MRNRNHNPGKRVQIILQDCQCRNVQIVVALIQDQAVGIGLKNSQKIQALFLPAGKLFDGRILHIGSEQKPLQHLGRRDPSVSGLDVFPDVFHIIDDPLARVQFRQFLGKVSDPHRLADLHRSAVRLHDPRNHFQQR